MGKRKQAKGDGVLSEDALTGNVVKFRTKAECEAERRAAHAVEPREEAVSTGGCVLAFPAERVKSRGPVFNLSYREASDGQRSLDFDGLGRPRAPCEVVPLRPANCARRAYDLYVRASALDEDPATYAEAAAFYEEALRLDPSLAVAEVNLANLHFRRGDARAAEAMYRHAIGIQHRCPEAHYNLGYVALEYGDARAAIDSFKVAIEQDARFADAHFNLAMAYEQVGNRSVARNHWRTYLNLEPQGMWADIARKHIS